MSQLLELLRLTLSQFAGGPGAPENNLVRFGLAAMFWLVLLAAAFSRRRAGTAPRENLLVWGFALGFVREMWMFLHMAGRLLSPEQHGPGCVVSQPAEHTLSMAAVVVVAGAFLQFILDDQRQARRFIAGGLAVALASLVLTTYTWTWRQVPGSELPFHQAWQAWLFHLPLTVMLIYAIAAISRGSGWLRNVVVAALGCFLIGEALVLVNYATGVRYNDYLCPIGNALHMISIPILGYVYYKEQANEKNRAQEALRAYQNRLEELVAERTQQLQSSNDQLELENQERRLAEAANARFTAELAARNTVAATLSQSLEQDVILKRALAAVLTIVRADVGMIALSQPGSDQLTLACQHGQLSEVGLERELLSLCACSDGARQAMAQMRTVVTDLDRMDTQRLPAGDKLGPLRQLVSTPLVAKGEPVGALVLGCRQPMALQPEQKALLTALGQQIGMAEENARHHQLTKQAAESLARLNRSAERLGATLNPDLLTREIVEQAAALTQSPAVYLLSYSQLEGQVDQLAHVGADMGSGEMDVPAALLRSSPRLIQDAGASQQVMVSDLPAPWQTPNGGGKLLGVRLLKVEGDILLLYLFARGGIPWRSQELELLDRFSHLAAAALANARLHRQLERSAALEERHRIAAELHDGLAQTLSVAAMTLDEAKLALAQQGSDGILPQLAQLESAVNRANLEARTSIRELNQQPSPPQSLQQMLRALLTDSSLAGGPKLALHVRLPRPYYLPDAQRALLLPLVKEAIHNARKHAGARQIDVRIEKAGQELLLTVADDGGGFDPGAMVDDGAGHYGLGIMRARAARMPGQLRIDSGPGRGTRVQLRWLPAEPDGKERLPLRSRLVEESEPMREVTP